MFVFFFKQKTAYEMCGRDWSSDVCSSDLGPPFQFFQRIKHEISKNLDSIIVRNGYDELDDCLVE